MGTQTVLEGGVQLRTGRQENEVWENAKAYLISNRILSNFLAETPPFPLTSVLVDRLEWVLDKIHNTHSDQTGFTRGRQLYSNLRQVYDVIFQVVIMSLRLLLLWTLIKHSTESHKHICIFCLKNLELGPLFCSWVNLLCCCPQAGVRTNNNMS